MMNAPTDSNRVEEIRKVAFVDYCLHIGGMIFTVGLLTLIAIVLNYMKRSDADGTYVRSHIDYMIKYWWRWLFWMIGLSILIFVIGILSLGIGFFLLGWVLVIPSIIFVIRMVLGLLKLNAGRPIE